MYAGPGNKDAGLEELQRAVADVPKDRQIVLYCGCCPWDKCPNVGPGYAELKKLGFTNVKVLHIGNNIGTDWVDPGHPTERGM